MTKPVLFTGPPICVVGNINRDVELQNVPASERLFEDGETSVHPITETIGGGGANSACAAAALGASVRFIGKLGTDALGERLQQAMQRNSVQMHAVRDTHAVTGTTVALGMTSGHRHFLSYLPNNETLCYEDIDLAALEGCAHLLRADVWFSQPMLEGGNFRLFTEAHRRGIATSLDLNFDPCWSGGDKERIGRRKQLLREALGLVDLAHGNARELCEFTNSSELDTALGRLAEWGVKAVVVHLGGRGAGYWSNGKLVIEPPNPARAVVNSTGTGDVLSVCMILLYSRTDLSIQEKLRCSNQIVREFMEGERTLIPAI